MKHAANKADHTQPQALSALRRSLCWRLHFWSALIASPFALIAALTGILYVFTPQIESVLYRQFDQVQAQGTARQLDELVAAASLAAPRGWRVHSV
ncbi:MAG: PepSY-associated TM helix domain-containing protein, partial [Pseudomonadota bacterium]